MESIGREMDEVKDDISRLRTMLDEEKKQRNIAEEAWKVFLLLKLLLFLLLTVPSTTISIYLSIFLSFFFLYIDWLLCVKLIMSNRNIPSAYTLSELCTLSHMEDFQMTMRLWIRFTAILMVLNEIRLMRKCSLKAVIVNVPDSWHPNQTLLCINHHCSKRDVANQKQSTRVLESEYCYSTSHPNH